ncbi:hypothetical protein PSHT_14983 [Puccinia striiformis]|nr:hypothetical protein PSHT_14983 [Puccinia striiformis]
MFFIQNPPSKPNPSKPFTDLPKRPKESPNVNQHNHVLQVDLFNRRPVKVGVGEPAATQPAAVADCSVDAEASQQEITSDIKPVVAHDGPTQSSSLLGCLPTHFNNVPNQTEAHSHVDKLIAALPVNTRSRAMKLTGTLLEKLKPQSKNLSTKSQKKQTATDDPGPKPKKSSSDRPTGVVIFNEQADKSLIKFTSQLVPTGYLDNSSDLNASKLWALVAQPPDTWPPLPVHKSLFVRVAEGFIKVGPTVKDALAHLLFISILVAAFKTPCKELPNNLRSYTNIAPLLGKIDDFMYCWSPGQVVDEVRLSEVAKDFLSTWSSTGEVVTWSKPRARKAAQPPNIDLNAI